MYQGDSCTIFLSRTNDEVEGFSTYSIQQNKQFSFPHKLPRKCDGCHARVERGRSWVGFQVRSINEL